MRLGQPALGGTFRTDSNREMGYCGIVGALFRPRKVQRVIISESLQRSFLCGLCGATTAVVVSFAVLSCAGSDASPTNGSKTTDGATQTPSSTLFEGVRWQCVLGESSCTCDGIPPDLDEDFGGASGELDEDSGGSVSKIEIVVACSSDRYSCCLNTLTSDGTYRCKCSDLTNCAAEAASRQNTEAVVGCPPVPNTRCAKQTENCRAEYLSEMDYEGCCPGLSCLEGSDGVPTCQ